MPGDDGSERHPPSTMEPTATMSAPDGVPIAVYDLGGTGPGLVLVHATGFCGPVLAAVAGAVGGGFHTVLLDLRAHGRSGPAPGGDLRWGVFATDVLAVVDGLGLESPLGFGHSCGGAALVLAEEARPGTFGALYLFEPIILPFDTPPDTGMPNPLAEGARRRRSQFASRLDALANFSSKPPFDVIRPDVLAAYVDNGFAPVPGGGIRLRCDRDDEAETYVQSVTHDAYARMAEVRCPVTVSCGEHTDAIGPDFLALYAARLGRPTTVVLHGLGHFGPLQDPDMVGRSVAEAFSAAPWA